MLRAFIDYTAENYPAEMYDLILWDHGGGITSGFGSDEIAGGSMSVAGLMDALSDNKVIDTVGKFDLIDFDAYLMGTLEIALSLADYMDYYVSSPETEPGYGQNYEHWLTMLGSNPYTNGYTLGKKIVDDFYDFYEPGYADGSRQEATLSVIDMKKLFAGDFLDLMSDIVELMRTQARTNRQFYDELRSFETSLEYGKGGYLRLQAGSYRQGE